MNHPIPLPLKGDCLFIDNSGMTTYMSCPRQGAYSYSLKRKPNRPSPALTFGGAIHEALETRYRIHHDKPLIDAQMFDDMVDSMIAHYEKEEADLDTSEWRNVSYAIQTLSEYVTKYRYEQPNTYYHDGEPCVEIPFALPIGSMEVNATIWVTDPDINNGEPTTRYVSTVTIYVTGKIDMIVKRNGNCWLLDHKTTSIGGPSFFDEFQTSTQFKGYKWAAQKIIGQPIAGIIINALMCRKPKADGTTNYTFERNQIPIHDDHVDEWQNTFLTTVYTFIQQHVDQEQFNSPEQSFPMNTPWCKGKYGTCPFFDVCTLRPYQREQMIYSGLYTDNTWSPIKEEQRVNLGKNRPVNLPNILLTD